MIKRKSRVRWEVTSVYPVDFENPPKVTSCIINYNLNFINDMDDMGYGTDVINYVKRCSRAIHEELKDNDIVIISDRFGTGKSTTGLSTLKNGDIFSFDTHKQAREKKQKTQSFFPESTQEQVASVRKNILVYLHLENNPDEEKENQDVIIPPNIEKALQRADNHELSDFLDDLEYYMGEEKSSKQIALLGNYSDDIIHLCKQTSKYYDPDEDYLNDKQIFTVKDLLGALKLQGILFIDESITKSFKTKKRNMRSENIHIEKINNVLVNNMTHITTPSDMKETMNDVEALFERFSLDTDRNDDHTYQKLMAEFNGVQRQIKPSKIKELVGKDLFESIEDTDVDDFREKAYDIAEERDKERKKNDKEVAKFIHPEIEFLPKLRFAKHLVKYGGRIKRKTNKDIRKDYLEIEIIHAYMYDMLDKVSEGNKAVVFDAEFNKKLYLLLCRRWINAQKGGASMKDIPFSTVQVAKEKEINIPLNFINISPNKNPSLSQSSFTSSFRDNKYSKSEKERRVEKDKYLRLIAFKNYIKDRIENHDEKHGIIVIKKGMDGVFSDIPDENILYYAKQEGSNELKDVVHHWVVGTPRPSDEKRLAEIYMGEELPSPSEIVDEYDDVHYSDIITGSVFKNEEYDGKAQFNRAFTFNISQRHKKILGIYREIWDSYTHSKIRQAIGRKRNIDIGSFNRIGMFHPDDYYGNFTNMNKYIANEFLSEKIRDECMMFARDTIKEYNEILKNNNKISSIPPYIRKPFEGKNSKSGSNPVKEKKKPNGYNKEELVKCMKRRGYSLSEISKETRISKKDIRNM